MSLCLITVLWTLNPERTTTPFSPLETHLFSFGKKKKITIHTNFAMNIYYYNNRIDSNGNSFNSLGGSENPTVSIKLYNIAFTTIHDTQTT